MQDFVEGIDWSRWSETFWTTSVRILLIVAVTYVALYILRRALRPAIAAGVAAQMAGQPEVEVERRVRTLFGLVYRSIWTVAVMIMVMTVLSELGVNVTALVAGAGIAGLTISFGAQSLVRDTLGGIFILAENQYARGDTVTIAGVTGTVEQVTLRRTVLRTIDGAVHNVPNGLIQVSTNSTHVQATASVAVSVAYGEDLDRVFAVINRVGEELAADSDWSKDVLNAPKALGVEEFGESAVRILVMGDTNAGRQVDVTRELRKRIKAAFDAQGIEVPYPHRTLVTTRQKATDGLVVRQAAV